MNITMNNTAEAAHPPPSRQKPTRPG